MGRLQQLHSEADCRGMELLHGIPVAGDVNGVLLLSNYLRTKTQGNIL